MSNTPPVALTIAGSDSGGGAGIQADLATFAALGVHGTSAITAVTVQDTRGVHAIHHLPAELVVAQVNAVLLDLRPCTVKLGMLGTGDVVRAIGELAAAGLLPRLVVDPVLVATSGDALATEGVTAVLRDTIVPHATLVTPNTDEAAALLDTTRATTADAQVDQARSLLALGPTAVVVTGGITHGVKGVERVDVLVTADTTELFQSAEIVTTNDHGTGCTFASAAAAFLARGETVHDAVLSARAVVRHALRTAAPWHIGDGRGPVAHTSTALFDQPTTQGAFR